MLGKSHSVFFLILLCLSCRLGPFTCMVINTCVYISLQLDRTPLHYANAVSEDMVSILETHGADPLAQDVVSSCILHVLFSLESNKCT